MRLRVHIEFVGFDRIKITKFSGSKTINVKDLQNKWFDIDSFSLVDRYGKTDFCVAHWDGDGSLSEPYELVIYKRNYDTSEMEEVGFIHAKDKREITVEETLVP